MLAAFGTLHMYAQELVRAMQRLERVVNTIIFFIAINNNYYSYTDWYIITIVQTSKLAT